MEIRTLSKGTSLQVVNTECQKIFKVTEQILNIIIRAMENFRVELAEGGQTLIEVNTEYQKMFEITAQVWNIIVRTIETKEKVESRTLSWRKNHWRVNTERQKIFKTPEQIWNIFTRAIENWRLELLVGRITLQ